MADATPISFETHSGAPVRIVATAADGAKYELSLGVIIVEVNQRIGDTNAEGLPVFEVKAGFAISSKKVAQT